MAIGVLVIFGNNGKNLILFWFRSEKSECIAFSCYQIIYKMRFKNAHWCYLYDKLKTIFDFPVIK